MLLKVSVYPCAIFYGFYLVIYTHASLITVSEVASRTVKVTGDYLFIAFC